MTMQIRPLRNPMRGPPRERPRPGAHAKRQATRPYWVGLTPVPDRGFVRKLRGFDPGLSVEFNRGLSRFVIMQEGRISGRAVAMVVQGGEAHGQLFRQPDERDLMKLRAVDMHNERTRRRMIDERERELAEQPVKDYERDRQELIDASKDDKHQIRRAWQETLGTGKPTRHVAQKAPKTPRPRGRVHK